MKQQDPAVVSFRDEKKITSSSHRNTTARAVGQSTPISILDRPWLAAQSAVTFGPLNLPSLADLRSAFVDLAAMGARTRAGFTFDSAHQRWLFDPTRLDELAEQVITAQPGELAGSGDESAATAEAERLLDTVQLSGHRPLTLVRTEDFLVQRQNHAFGDARSLLNLSSSLVQFAASGQLPKWVHEDLSAHPARSALRNVLADNRKPLAHLVRDRPSKVIRSHKDPGEGGLVPWTPQPKVAAFMFSRASWDAVQQWRRANASQASMASVYLVVLRLALRKAGIPLSADTVVLYDCRRYLPSGEHVRGNFVTVRSHQFEDDAVSAGATIAETAESAQPLGTLIMASVKRRILPPRRHHSMVSTQPHTVPAFVFAPRNGSVEALPWQLPNLRCIASANTPSSPADLTASMMMLGGRLNVSFSFHANVLPEAAIRRTAQLMEHQALDLLTSSGV